MPRFLQRQSADQLTPNAPQAVAGRRDMRRFLFEIAQTTLQTVLIMGVLMVLIARFQIEQSSMLPTFVEGQRVFVVTLGNQIPTWLVGNAYAASAQVAGMRDLHRGQVVVFYRDSEQHGQPLIKRVIGLPGDTITIQGGQVFVNGMLLDEPYVHGLLSDCNRVCGPVMLCADQYFVMGDNRPVSVDSRDFGPISGSAIVGRVVARFWPLDSVMLFP